MAIKFPQVVERKDTITVDGYSDRKHLEAAIKDFGKYIEKRFKNGEGGVLVSMVADGITDTNTPYTPASSSCGGYFFEWEEVSCASMLNEDTGVMEYADGNYYFVIRMVK